MRQAVLTAIVFVALALLPIIAWQVDEPYMLDTTARLVVFAIAATGLNLVTGYGGLVSLGHAMFIGLGAYTVGIMAHHGLTNGFLQLATMLAVTGLAAVVLGSIALRARGVFFIMITLALSQIFYYLTLSTGRYGGEEGLAVLARSEYLGLIDMYDPYQFYALCVAVLALAVFLKWRLINSPFGQVIVSIRENEKRARAIGYNTFKYKLTVMVISGVMCGLSGFLLANLSDFVSPDYGYWSRSAELLVMVLLGGMGTLIGPILGALTFLSLEDWAAGVTSYRGLVIGPLLIAVVLVSRGGIMGLIGSALELVRRSRS